MAIEKVGQIKGELEAVAKAEHEEVESGWRPFSPDWHSMEVLERLGNFKILVARRGGQVVGYFCWMVDFDMESYGTLIANQGAWYVKPGEYATAFRMFRRAKQELKVLGVKFLYLHHTVRGRGATLGKFFEKEGAELLGYNYVMRM